MHWYHTNSIHLVYLYSYGMHTGMYEYDLYDTVDYLCIPDPYRMYRYGDMELSRNIVPVLKL